MNSSELAIDGGPPVLANARFPWPVANESVRAAILESIDDGTWGQYEGPWTDQLISRLQAVFQVRQAMLCSSGTIAVELALRGVGVRPDTEVIMAGYDFPGNFRAIEAIGACPVLVDVVKDGWVLCPSAIEPAFSDRTSAIIVSHLHGQVADLARIREMIASRKSLNGQSIAIVEDACQVPGGRINGKPLGGFGDVAALSFGGSKLISAGRGGAILTNDAEILQRAKIFGQRGNDAFPLSQLQAAVIGPQLDSLDVMTQQRNAQAQRLAQLLLPHTDLIHMKQLVSDSLAAYYKVPWLLRDRTPGWSRADFLQALIAEGVPAGEGFRGFLRRSPRRCRKLGALVNCQAAAQQTVLLHHPVLLESNEIIDSIAMAIGKVISCSR